MLVPQAEEPEAHSYGYNPVAQLDRAPGFEPGVISQQAKAWTGQGAQLRLSERSGRPLTEEADGPGVGFQREGQIVAR